MILILRELPAPERLLLVIDDSPTKRYGPHVEGADVHHNPTPGPADQPFLYGHVWVTISMAPRHPQWGPLALPLRAMLYVRKQTLATIPKSRRWGRFASKLQQAARLVEWIVPIVKESGKTVWIVIDGGYTKRPFLRRVSRIANVLVVGRLRKDAALRDMPPTLKQRGRGRPRKDGKNRISLAKRAGQRRGWQTVECVVYSKVTIGPTAGAKHLDQRGRVQLESLDAYAGGTLGVGQTRKTIDRPTVAIRPGTTRLRELLTREQGTEDG